ncbi:MAG: outer membrane protein transport protein, partial [Candidatus Competibacteraceae bacterium]|nr:outer membrane protein transport protein [Candidatus Competibacteraceae bacterium]
YHDWAINGKIGVLYEPSPTTRIGLTYTSKTDYDYQVSTDVTFTYAIPSHPDLTVTRTFALPLEGMVNTPQQLMISLFHQIDPGWAILTNIGWQDWSVYNDNAIFAANREIPGSNRIRDTWHVAFGVQHQVNENLRLNSGMAYDSSFYKNQDNTSLTMPSGDAWRFGVGAQYQLDKNSSLGAAFEYLQMEKSSVPNILLSGNYDTSRLYFFTANYSHRF